MKGIIILFASSVVGGIFWWIGSFVGLMTAVLLSALGTGVGIWLARKFIQDHLE